MRPTGRLHLGHYRGVLMNWIKLQHEYECFFFVADWHALTTHYEERDVISDTVLDMVIDWLACGIDPADARLFVQSRIPEHAELHLLLSMVTPLGWLERVPSYKDQRERLTERDLDTYGFLGYPVLQSADILIYRAGLVPVGEDQAAHVEVTREIARRFNNIFGREPDFEERVESATRKMGKRNARLYRDLRRRFQEQGDDEALATARALLDTQQNISIGDRERLMGNLDGGGRAILPEPHVLLTPASRMPGVDGQKMSKSYGNTIELREDPEQIASKLRRMPTDPARVRRSDPGDPEKCPVWKLHEIYSDEGCREWVRDGCRSAGIGCLDCKQPLIDAVLAELEPIRTRALEYASEPDVVRSILQTGCEEARETANETMEEVRRAMGFDYR